jgi:hypothetical protein
VVVATAALVVAKVQVVELGRQFVAVELLPVLGLGFVSRLLAQDLLQARDGLSGGALVARAAAITSSRRLSRRFRVGRVRDGLPRNALPSDKEKKTIRAR